MLFPLLMLSRLSKSLTHLSTKTLTEYVVKIRNTRGWFHNNKKILIMISTTLVFFVGVTLFPLIAAQIFGRKFLTWSFNLQLITHWKVLFLWKFVGLIYEILFIFFLGKTLSILITQRQD